MGLGPTGHMPFFCHNGDPLSQPPPAHMGIPPYQLDSKGAASMGEYGGSPQPQPLSPAEWRRLGPLLAATGILEICRSPAISTEMAGGGCTL
ncbi:unnamed protein product [Diabrotica balteata]|uniref:Uncharacterized protein n=1 Tax=Diabrotica balteata TaxID=107213 RepID=A0A9N9XIC0_DIABA|nr:unnamed protein product [Diabrotica balteata]